MIAEEGIADLKRRPSKPIFSVCLPTLWRSCQSPDRSGRCAAADHCWRSQELKNPLTVILGSLAHRGILWIDLQSQARKAAQCSDGSTASKFNRVYPKRISFNVVPLNVCVQAAVYCLMWLLETCPKPGNVEPVKGSESLIGLVWIKL